MIGNGDVYENGERIIDGTISKDHTTTSGEITTELAVANVIFLLPFFHNSAITHPPFVLSVISSQVHLLKTVCIINLQIACSKVDKALFNRLIQTLLESISVR